MRTGPLNRLMPPGRDGVAELSERSRDIFRQIVDAYVETGEPIGSRTISRRLGMSLSPATIRNVMADLEEMGLLYAPHTSAGRLPTEAGLRLFVQAMMEVGDVSEDERTEIETQCSAAGRAMTDVLEEASTTLSGLSACAGLVFAPKTDRPLRHVEFVPIGPGRALVVLVTEGGIVENRILEVPLGIPPSALVQATNFLNAHIAGKTLAEARAEIQAELDRQKTQLDQLAAGVIASGLAVWGGPETGGTLIVKGQSRLLNDVTAVSQLESIRALFEALEAKETVLRMLDQASQADGVQIFIGAENTMFRHTGCSAIIAPFKDGRERVVGAVGVIGPTRLNYARIVPMVDYTAKVVGRILWNKKDGIQAA